MAALENLYPVVRTPSQARVAVGQLIGATRAPVEVRAVAAGWLGGRSARELVLLDDHARGYLPDDAPAWTHLSPSPHSTSDPTGLFWAVASLHPQGRIRERAVQGLALRTGPATTAMLALRLDDHVPQVQAAAREGLADRTSVAAAQEVLPVLLALSGRRRGAPATSRFLNGLRELHGVAVVREFLHSSDGRTRRWAFATCLAAELLTVDDLVHAVVHEHDQTVRRTAAVHLVNPRRTPSLPVLLELLASRSVDARFVALSALPEELLGDDALEAGLLDRSARVRDSARWRAGRRGLDATAVHRRFLADADADASSVRTIAALTELGGRGAAGDLPLATGRLSHHLPGVRAAAVHAVAALAPPADVVAAVGELLLDPSSKVATAAADALGTVPAPLRNSALHAARVSGQPWSRRAAWRLGRSGGGWDRVESDLRAAADVDHDLATLGRAGLRSWLSVGAATAWQRLPAAQAERIGFLVDFAGLDEDTTRSVRFHAGPAHRP